MKLLVDMNLSPEWAPFLNARGFEAVHWSEVGDWSAEDRVILQWALERDHIVFTNDLDFGRLLALTYARGPSVIQIRGADLLPESLGEVLVSTLESCERALLEGALLVVDRASPKTSA